MKEKLKNREKVFGGWVSLGHPQIAEIIAKSGVDFIGIDMEHSTISQAEAQRIIAVCHANGILCLPRVASHNEEMVKRLLDSSADGIVYPSVENGEQMEKLAKWCHYPPIGNRGYGVARAQGYGMAFDEYINTHNKKVIVIGQIESIEAVNNIDKILQHCDGVVIGPFDLSGSLGIPGQIKHPNVMNACYKVIKACYEHKKSCGTQIIEVNKTNVKNALNSGFNIIIMASDIFLFAKWSEDTKEIIEGV